jgi:hypothetical protein
MGAMSDDDIYRQWIPSSVLEGILPRLAETSADWSKPLNAWTRSEMVTFLNNALDLIRDAMIVRKASVPFDDEIPF